MTRIYLAGRYDRRAELATYAEQLEDRGYVGNPMKSTKITDFMVELGERNTSAGAVLEPPASVTQEVEAPMCSQDTPTPTEDTTEEIPYGYCHCGCGQATRIAHKTINSRGVVKGEPNRFIAGHAFRVIRPRAADIYLPVIVGDFAAIPMPSDKYPDLFTLVDVADIDEVGLLRWYPRRGGSTFYVCNSRGKQLHRIVMGVTDPSIDVDHINGNGLDNRRRNLRLATKSQNAANCHSSAIGRSGFYGVYWDSGRQRWSSAIRTREGRKYLGLFEREEDAAAAYDSMARIVFGEFARLNFPNAESEAAA